MSAPAAPSAAAPAAPSASSRRAARAAAGQSRMMSSSPASAAGPSTDVHAPEGRPTSAPDFDAALRALGGAAARVAGTNDTDAPAASSSSDAPAASSSSESSIRVPAPGQTRSSFRRLATVGSVAGAMGVAALIAVSMTLPSQAVASSAGAAAATSLVVGERAKTESAAGGEEQIQAFIAPNDVQNPSLQSAQGFTAMSQADVAAESGIRFSSELYTNDRTAAIQWPYAVGVAMSSPYGPRDGRMHQGIDLIPGEGAPIQAIADGVVRLASENDGGYGVGIYIDHIIDGKPITSHYGHMIYGSMRVKTGDTVKVGDIIGLTGNTGNSYGAHLHFELYVNDATIDPLPWLQANAGRKSLNEEGVGADSDQR
ncbi:M23 family metallopeptidase [Microbacterium resistens]|uniref:M23 family metallopeptidase n=1 Tax=Microbacterium resistens TaxID=156977 RepID=UPI0012F93191|nr:M23 family metallopeptidase [Microbacterium resistens]